MSLPSGARLGPYEILSPLGAGGMGEVYEARDTRLDRTVAVKVLPERLALDPALRARFEREARAVSKVSHPNICTLHDVGEAELPSAALAPAGAEGKTAGGRTVSYLVMERLEGETLESRLRRGPLPTAEVLELGRQIALALAAAHRQGVVHRDLKPANVMLTRDGAKLLDFGLARLLQEAEASSQSELDVMVTEPRKEAPLTGEGTILGTFFYMAPEQVEGREADARSDIFALGTVLYEMATGRRAFEGATRASVIAAVLEREPEPISRAMPLAPPALDHVVSRCLAKDPEERWQSAQDVAVQLGWIADQGSQAGVPAPVTQRRRSRQRLAWATAALLGLLAATLAGFHFTGPPPETPPRVRFTVEPLEGVGFHRLHALSPDGTHLVFAVLGEDGRSQLWLRALNSLEARPLPGTEGGEGPFWSPDGRSLGFFAEGELRRFDLDGSVRTIASPAAGAGASWSSRGVILFGFEQGLFRVPEAGGLPVEVPVFPGGEAEGVLSFWPNFLPDGDRFLFSVLHPDLGGLYLGTLSSGERKRLGGLDDPRALSLTVYDETGHLLFARDGVLLAQRLDLERGELLGEPVRISDRVLVAGPGAAHFSISRNGILAFRELDTEVDTQLTWLDRSGEPIGTLGPRGAWANPRISPDGRWVVAVRAREQEAQVSIWLLEVARGTTQRLTSGFFAAAPAWSPHGESLAFGAAIGAPPNPFLLLLDRPGELTRVARYAYQAYPTDWSPDGDSLVLTKARGPGGLQSLWRLSPAGDGEAVPLVSGEGEQLGARISPDGRWLAYASSQSGRWEVYVTTFPEAGRSRLVSTGGGSEPRWSPDGGTLYYLAPDRTLMAVPIATEPTLSPGLPEPLFTTPAGGAYDVGRDGQRFLFAVPTGDHQAPPIHVVVNWRAGL